MNPSINQPDSQLSPDRAKASLGMATRLQDMLLPQAQPQGQQTPESGQQPASAPQPQKDPMTEMQGLKDEIMKELQTMKQDIQLIAQGDPKEERSQVSELKKQIEDVLNEPD